MTQKPLLQYLKQKQYWVNALMTMFFVLYINRMYSGGSEYGWFNLHGMPGVAWWILIVTVMVFAVTYLLLAFKRAVMKIQTKYTPNNNTKTTDFFIAFSNNLTYTALYKVMQSKFMSVKCLPDGELPEDEKRNLAVHGLLLAATEDKHESINYLLL